MQSTPVLQVDIRSNYHACHAGMRNRKMTRNVCITLGQMFPPGRGTAQRDPVLLVRLFFLRIRAIFVDDLHPRRGRSICFSSLYEQARGLSISSKS